MRSSRRLEADCRRNIEVIWLLRSLKPDFKTIADFRSANRTAFKKIFREFVILCRNLDLFGRELLAVDAYSCLILLAGGPGFEPRLTESESAVLPLNYPPPALPLGRAAR